MRCLGGFGSPPVLTLAPARGVYGCFVLPGTAPLREMLTLLLPAEHYRRKPVPMREDCEAAPYDAPPYDPPLSI